MKSEFRKKAKIIRQNVLNKNNKTKSILKNLISMPEYQNAQTIFSYMSIQSEVETFDINAEILRKKKTLALPKVYLKSMEFHSVCDLESDTCKGAFGVLEPKEQMPVIEKFDLILVPAVAFCKQGFRMGYGAGFYDRYLSGKKGIFIGICFDEQIFDEIPKDEFDVKMHYLVTPSGVRKLC